MTDCLMVGLGGFIGSAGRYLLGKVSVSVAAGFPIQTFFINLLGCFLIGCLAAIAERETAIGPRAMLFLKTGFCGGFTTFSTFALETSALMEGGHIGTAFLYVALSAVMGVVLVFAAEAWLRV